MTKRPGSFVYEPANMQAFVSTPIMKEVLARAQQNKAKVGVSAKKPGAKATGAKPGATKPGATNPGAAAGH
jgi:hypothetical protein